MYNHSNYFEPNPAVSLAAIAGSALLVTVGVVGFVMGAREHMQSPVATPVAELLGQLAPPVYVDVFGWVKVTLPVGAEGEWWPEYDNDELFVEESDIAGGQIFNIRVLVVGESRLRLRYVRHGAEVVGAYTVPFVGRD